MTLKNLTPLEKKQRQKEQIRKYHQEHREELLNYRRNYRETHKIQEMKIQKIYFPKYLMWKKELIALMNIQYL
jgi:hypothetical protein